MAEARVVSYPAIDTCLSFPLKTPYFGSYLAVLPPHAPPCTYCYWWPSSWLGSFKNGFEWRIGSFLVHTTVRLSLFYSFQHPRKLLLLVTSTFVSKFFIA